MAAWEVSGRRGGLAVLRTVGVPALMPPPGAAPGWGASRGPLLPGQHDLGPGSSAGAGPCMRNPERPTRPRSGCADGKAADDLAALDLRSRPEPLYAIETVTLAGINGLDARVYRPRAQPAGRIIPGGAAPAMLRTIAAPRSRGTGVLV